MFEFHGWATIRFTAENRDRDDEEQVQNSAVEAVQSYVRRMGYGPLTLRTGRGPAGSQATPAAIRSVGACRRSPRLGYYGRDAWSEEQLLSEPYRHVFFHPHAESGSGLGQRNREAVRTSGGSRQTPRHGRSSGVACGGRKPDAAHFARGGVIASDIMMR